VERKGEREAHVILTQERFLHNVEITFNAWEHSFVGIGSDRDVVVAASTALDKLEKQIMKLRTKWRDTSRHKDKEATLSRVISEVPADGSRAKAGKTSARFSATAKTDRKKVFRVNHGDGSKPMTLEEAMLEMEASQDYLVYRDARTDRVTVLMRRPDGHFDLIES
jgi:putative sigma-54 modulation protein